MAEPRQHFTIDRQMEYFTEAELTKQMGSGPEKWAITLIKELIDNSLDAAESVNTPPEIIVTIDRDSMSVQDNGPGIPDHVIDPSLNFSVKVSDKQNYISPSRGQQGNALMCVYSVPYVLNGDHAMVEIHTNGKQHDIDVSLNRIAQAPEILKTISESEFVENGTLVKINYACVPEDKKSRISTKFEFINLLDLFSCCNPHASFTLIFDGETYRKTKTGNQVKWTTAMPLCCHWYGYDEFTTLLTSMIHQSPEMKVNQFLSKFDGIKATPKQKQVCDDTGISSRDGIMQFVTDKDVDEGKVHTLLDSMQGIAKEIKPCKLGLLNQDHVKNIWAVHDYQIYESASSKGFTSKGLPYTLDVFFQAGNEYLYYHKPDLCLNNSVLIDGSIFVVIADTNIPIDTLLDGTYIEPSDPVKLLIHITCPSFDFLGKGKNNIAIPSNDNLFNDLKKQIAKVSKDWTKAKKRTRRGERAELKEIAINQRQPSKMNQIQAVAMLLEAAYMKVSNNNTLPANFRQVYYALRPDVLRLIGSTSFDDNYCRKLVRAFEAENPELTKDWDIVYDARGHLIEPFTGKTIPIGTLSVRAYTESWSDIRVTAGGELAKAGITIPKIITHGHKGVYRFLLLIEKEGFGPLIDAVKIQDRYGIAVASTKGMGTEAARVLIEKLSNEGVTIFVLHDFDQAGFTIANTLKHDTETFQFKTKPNVIDIGFRLEDIQGLEREPVKFKTAVISPRESIIESGATPEEADILVQGKKPDTWIKGKKVAGKWYGERVEINAMTSAQLIAFIESKLEEHGVKKVVPSGEILREAYRNLRTAALKQKAMDEIMARHMPEIQRELSKYTEPQIDIPENLIDLVEKGITGNTKRWEMALTELV